MKTITNLKTKELKGYIKKLKGAGFKVYAPEELSTYCHFTKNGKIGYVEAGDFGFNFSTVHKPNTRCGTGFSIHREVSNPTIKMAEDCFVNTPHWAMSDISHVKKYTNWTDYTNSPTNRIIEKIEV